jgi:hypothetical protein
MPFFPINKNSTYGRSFVRTGIVAGELVDEVSAHVARISEMTDQQFTDEYVGSATSGLTRTAALTTLTDVKTLLDNVAIRNLRNRIG